MVELEITAELLELMDYFKLFSCAVTKLHPINNTENADHFSFTFSVLTYAKRRVQKFVVW